MSEVANRYATALSEIDGIDHAEVEKSLEVALETVSSDDKLYEFYISPRIVKEGKKKVIKKVFTGKLNQNILSLLLLLVDKGREEVLGGILDEFVKENDRRLGRIRAHVTFSRDIIDFTDKEGIAVQVRKAIIDNKTKFGFDKDIQDASLQIESKVNPEILGGFIIRIGDYLLDRSVRTYINRWRVKVAESKLEPEKVWQD